MKKKYSYLSLIILLFSFIIVFMNNNIKVKADSGNDASYSSSSSSSSSSHDYSSSSSSHDYSSSSSSSHSGGGHGDPKIALFLTLFIFGFCFIFTYLLLHLLKSSNPHTKGNFYVFGLKDYQIYEKLGNNFDINKFIQDAFKIYYDVQIAWMNNDIDSVRNILSDELYNSYKMQLLPMQQKNEKNMMENIKLLNAAITIISFIDNKLEIQVEMDVTCNDYIINTTTGRVMRGNKYKKCKYLYMMTFSKSLNNQIDKCPNCNAKLAAGGESIKCPYCGSIVKKDSNNFVLKDKKMIMQK